MEQLKNHAGEDSVRVLRPADAHETTVAWKIALENHKTPTALILSRQGIKDLPAQTSRYREALQAEKGAYIVMKDAGTPDVVLVANGSEVSTLVDAAEKLRSGEGLAIQIVSAISEGLFRQQPEAYRREVLPEGVPTFGLTAGLPSTLQGLVGCNGIVYGMRSFGYSAPYKVLDEKLGFTGEHVYEEVVKFLGK
jgi:transketolase